MKFSERYNFDINQDLTAQDYIQISKINRMSLRGFLQMFNENEGFKSMQQDGPNEEMSPNSSMQHGMSPMN